MAEKLRIREVINETNGMNEDENSPLHGLGEPEKLAAMMMAHKAFGCFVDLLEYDHHEEIAVLFGQLCAAMRACLQRPALRRLGATPIVAKRRRQISTSGPWSTADLEAMTPHQMDTMELVMGSWRSWSSEWRMAPKKWVAG